MLMAQTLQMGHGYAQKYVRFLEGKDGEEQFSLVSAFAGASVEISVGHCFLAEDRDASSASCVKKCVCELNGKKCTEEAKKCFLLLIHHFVSLCSRMDQVCQADQGFNH